jgi:hypothetical protein
MRTLLLLLICAGYAVCTSGAAYAPYSTAYWTPTAVVDFYADPFLLAIRDIESSAGRDCERPDQQALTCYQIKPATASWVSCPANWSTHNDGSAALQCARLVLAKAGTLCRRLDSAGLAHFYRWGLCLSRHAKPSGYVLDVLDRKRRYL